MTTWNPPHINPPEVSGGYPWESIDVLVFDRLLGMHVGYKQIWRDDDEERIQWVIKGRDGYHLDDVISWTLLPEPPK